MIEETIERDGYVYRLVEGRNIADGDYVLVGNELWLAETDRFGPQRWAGISGINADTLLHSLLRAGVPVYTRELKKPREWEVFLQSGGKTPELYDAHGNYLGFNKPPEGRYRLIEILEEPK